jgi:hypothetical protein
VPVKIPSLGGCGEVTSRRRLRHLTKKAV